MNDQRRAAVTNQLFNRLTLFLLAMVAVTDKQKIPGVVGHLFHRFDHRPEERVRDITHHQTNGFCGLLGQRPGVGVRVVIELFHGAQHRLAGGITGFGRVVNNAGDRRNRDSRKPRNILNSRHSVPSGVSVYTAVSVTEKRSHFKPNAGCAGARSQKTGRELRKRRCGCNEKKPNNFR